LGEDVDKKKWGERGKGVFLGGGGGGGGEQQVIGFRSYKMQLLCLPKQLRRSQVFEIRLGSQMFTAFLNLANFCHLATKTNPGMTHNKICQSTPRF